MKYILLVIMMLISITQSVYGEEHKLIFSQVVFTIDTPPKDPVDKLNELRDSIENLEHHKDYYIQEENIILNEEESKSIILTCEICDMENELIVRRYYARKGDCYKLDFGDCYKYVRKIDYDNLPKKIKNLYPVEKIKEGK